MVRKGFGQGLLKVHREESAHCFSEPTLIHVVPGSRGSSFKVKTRKVGSLETLEATSGYVMWI